MSEIHDEILSYLESDEESDEEDDEEEEKEKEEDEEKEKEEINKQQFSFCIVCKKVSSKAHQCMLCNNFVHAICSEPVNDEEGYGKPVRYSICIKLINIDLI